MGGLGVCLMLALTAAGSPPSSRDVPDLSGWQNTRWGMDSTDLNKLVDLGVTRLPKREQFNGLYADYWIPKLGVCGVPFEVFLQMSNADDRLAQVLVRYTGNPNFRNTSLLSCLETDLSAKYGPLETQGKNRPALAQAAWVFPTTTVELEEVYIKGAVYQVTIRYYPTPKTGGANR